MKVQRVNPETFEAAQYVEDERMPDISPGYGSHAAIINDYARRLRNDTIYVHPGDWVLTDERGKKFVVSADAFRRDYRPVSES